MHFTDPSCLRLVIDPKLWLRVVLALLNFVEVSVLLVFDLEFDFWLCKEVTILLESWLPCTKVSLWLESRLELRLSGLHLLLLLRYHRLSSNLPFFLQAEDIILEFVWLQSASIFQHMTCFAWLLMNLKSLWAEGPLTCLARHKRCCIPCLVCVLIQGLHDRTSRWLDTFLPVLSLLWFDSSVKQSHLLKVSESERQILNLKWQ